MLFWTPHRNDLLKIIILQLVLFLALKFVTLPGLSETVVVAHVIDASVRDGS